MQTINMIPNYCPEIFMNAAGVVDMISKLTAEIEYDTVAVSGMSGVIPGTLLAYAQDLNLAVIRKVGEDRHHQQRISGHLGAKILIVDDFVSSGDTVRRIIETIRIVGVDYGMLDEIRIVGMVTYASMGKFRPTKDLSRYNDRLSPSGYFYQH